MDKRSQLLPLENKHSLYREFSQYVSDGRITLLEQKGIFPYDFVDSWEKLECTKFPSKDEFYSELTESEISDAEYYHAENVWRSFGCRNLGEYADLYSKTDVLLLCDVFERFRKTMRSLFRLDTVSFLEQ